MIKVGFQIDQLHKLNFKGDTSFMIMQEAYKRGFQIYFYYPFDMYFMEGKVFTKISLVKEIDLSLPIPIIYEEIINYDLQDLDVIFLRQDPPFDMSYITSTYLLEKLIPYVKIINNPISVRNSPEKLLVTEFHEYMPKTLITSRKEDILNFVYLYKQVIIKPLYGHGGSDVFLLEKNNFNCHSIIEYFLSKFKEQIIVQEFLPNIKKGDKRILIINGEVKGSFSRVPPKEGIKSNLVQGGKAVAAKITKKELQICSLLIPRLQELELKIVGLDIIDDHLVEINVTSPTGFRSVLDLEGNNLAEDVWNFILKDL